MQGQPQPRSRFTTNTVQGIYFRAKLSFLNVLDNLSVDEASRIRIRRLRGIMLHARLSNGFEQKACSRRTGRSERRKQKRIVPVVTQMAAPKVLQIRAKIQLRQRLTGTKFWVRPHVRPLLFLSHNQYIPIFSPASSHALLRR